MKRKLPVATVVLLLLVVATSSRAELFLRGNFGWLENNVRKTVPVGTPFNPGGGWSGEAGVGLSDRIRLSVEYGPSYTQPRRDIPQADGLGNGSVALMGALVTIDMEPIHRLEPHFVVGFGQSTFTFEYPDTGQVINIGGIEQRLFEEKLKGWSISLGFGFESPIFPWLLYGFRGRYLYQRWQIETDVGRLFPYESGNGFILEASIRVRT